MHPRGAAEIAPLMGGHRGEMFEVRSHKSAAGAKGKQRRRWEHVAERAISSERQPSLASIQTSNVR